MPIIIPAPAAPALPLSPSLTPVATIGAAIDLPAIPHLIFPLRLDRNGSLAMAQQDSDADVESAVFGILAQRKGYRLDRPEVGIDGPEFEQGGADIEAIRADLAEQEPRSVALFERDPALLARMVDGVSVTP